MQLVGREAHPQRQGRLDEPEPLVLQADKFRKAGRKNLLGVLTISARRADIFRSAWHKTISVAWK